MSTHGAFGCIFYRFNAEKVLKHGDMGCICQHMGCNGSAVGMQLEKRCSWSIVVSNSEFFSKIGYKFVKILFSGLLHNLYILKSWVSYNMLRKRIRLTICLYILYKLNIIIRYY